MGQVLTEELYYNNNLTHREIEYCDFLNFLSEHGKDNYDNKLVIIKGEVYDGFQQSEDEDMELQMINPDDFFDEFKDISGIENFEKDFISATYIDEQDLYSAINLVVNVHGSNERYTIDVA